MPERERCGRPPKYRSREEIEAAARAIGADSFIEKLPYGYDTDVSKRGGRVSAGQRQLISLIGRSVAIIERANSSRVSIRCSIGFLPR